MNSEEYVNVQEIIENSRVNVGVDQGRPLKFKNFYIHSGRASPAKKYCKEKNIQNMKVTASAKNARAIQFYIKN